MLIFKKKRNEQHTLQYFDNQSLVIRNSKGMQIIGMGQNLPAGTHQIRTLISQTEKVQEKRVISPGVPFLLPQFSPLLPSICRLTVSSPPRYHPAVTSVPTVTPADLHKVSLSRWFHVNLCPGFTHTCWALAPSTDPLGLQAGQWVAQGSPLSSRIRESVGTQLGDVCASKFPHPELPPFPRAVLTHSAQCERRSAAASRNSRLT